MNVYLIGFMGSGKSFAVNQLSHKYFSFDTDFSIMKITDLSISEIFQKYSEKKFRKIEKIIINEISYYKNLLVATGGGVLEKNRRVIKESGTSIFLDAQLDILWQRIKLENIERPKAADYDSFRKLYHKRLNRYKKAANFVVNAEDQRFVDEIAKVLKKTYFLNIDNSLDIDDDIDDALTEDKGIIAKLFESTNLRIKDFLDDNYKNEVNKNTLSKMAFIYIDIVSYILFFSGKTTCLNIVKNRLDGKSIFFLIPVFGKNRDKIFPEYFIIKDSGEQLDKLYQDKLSDFLLINNIYRLNQKILRELLDGGMLFSFIELVPDCYLSYEYKNRLAKLEKRYLHL